MSYVVLEDSLPSPISQTLTSCPLRIQIRQSGDLANIDGLDQESAAKLPALLQLRDALYSSAFRKYIASVAASGPLSGVKTDMAINVYTPGCHLLCHDDVIGSRRVSYILYLLDPDRPWKPEWGGALRLFPTTTIINRDGEEVKVPLPDPTVVIPPAFNQLSFFTVQPGESFHDVEEVYKRAAGDDDDDGGRERMAISGWFHIPQVGEEGYEEGLEEQLAERSSLQQLQGGKADEFDEPQVRWHVYDETEAATTMADINVNASNSDKAKSATTAKEDDQTEDDDEPELTGDDLRFLLQYMTASYLTPDTVEELNTMFAEESTLQLSNFLHPKFAKPLKAFLEAADREATMPGSASLCGVARPPHKHRYQYRHGEWPKPGTAELRKQSSDMSPLDELLNVLLVSTPFKKWVGLVMGLSLTKSSVLARRFRRGMDYTLATALNQKEPQLELCLGITPTSGWTGQEEDEEGENAKETIEAADLPGGYEIYMAPDEEEDDHHMTDKNGAAPASSGGTVSTSNGTGAGKRREKQDPAVYRTSTDGGDDGVLASMPPSWNTLSVVLREANLLRFTKYVSAAAEGDRWDVRIEYGVNLEDGDETDAEQE